MRLSWAPALALSLLACVPSHAGTITANSTFIGGLFGTFQVTFSSDIAGAKLIGVEYDLSTGVGGGPGKGLFLDPTGASPGYLGSQNLLALPGSGTPGFAGSTGITDGSTFFALSFNDFDSGETFNFELDIDHYIVLNNCAGLSGLARAACLAQNIGITANGSLVTADEFQGTTITFYFDTPYGPKDLTTNLETNPQIGAGAEVEGQIPEPGAWALTGTGLTLLLLSNRRRASLRHHLSRLR
jgi:hypothetical protein